MKGQVAITEYMVLIFMIAIIAFLAVLLLFGFEIFNLGSEQMAVGERSSLFVLQSLISSPSVTHQRYLKGSVFDDSKLTVATCEDLRKNIAGDWYADIRVIKDRNVCDDPNPWRRRLCLEDLLKKEGIVCTEQNYPECGSWILCEKSERMVYRSIPVNVYRKVNGTVELAVLSVGVPQGG